MDYVAIDFETANEQRSSACALGLVVVRGGTVVERASWLIRPPELRFNRCNIYVHGIRPVDVAGEPTFEQLWPAVSAYLEGNVVVAHNASFDMGVLRGVLDAYDIPHPHLPYACTRHISRRAWPELPRHGLAAVSAYLGFAFTHHVALQDALACAEIARRACLLLGTPSLPALLERLELSPAFLYPSVGSAGPATNPRPRSQRRW